MRSILLLVVVCCLCSTAPAQWQLQTSPTKSNLLSVSTREGAAWASGADSVVLHSFDGNSWQSCVAPPGGAHQELRSIQAIDATSALVMSAGRGNASKLYRTSDGCQSWQIVFTNPEPGSGFDSVRQVTAKQMYLLAEPVQNKFALYISQDAGRTWFIADDPGLDAEPGESAAGSGMLAQGPFLYFGTHGGSSPAVHYSYAKCDPAQPDAGCAIAWSAARLAAGSATGLYAVGARMQTAQNGRSVTTLMCVGQSATAGQAFVGVSMDNGARWMSPASPPAGDLRALAFAGANQAWYAAGTAGTFVSKDEGKTWNPAQGENAGLSWNAMALPFAVGENGEIGKLTAERK